MCNFCDGIKKGNSKTIQVSVRNTDSDDNICEKICSDGTGSYDCTNCYGCDPNNEYFSLNIYNDFMTVGYYHKIKDAIININSERVYIKYCPICGRKIREGGIIDV